MATIIFTVIAISLTITAFVLKIGMLYAVSIAAWTIETFLLGNQIWPAGNTYIQTATLFFGTIMIIVMAAATIMYYVNWARERRIAGPSDEVLQEDYKRQVYKLTHKKDRWE